MTIYEACGKEGYEELQFKNYDEDIKLLNLLLEDRSVKEEWGMPEVDIITKGKKGDCPYFWVDSKVLIISEKAKNELKDVWEKDNIELLPLNCYKEKYYIVHIMNADQVSYDFTDDYNIKFDEGECIKAGIADKFLFRSYIKAKFKDKSTFINEKFIERVARSDLKGFGFKVIWES